MLWMESFKIYFLEILSNRELCIVNDSSSEKVFSWVAISAATSLLSWNLCSSLGNSIFSISTCRSMSSRTTLSLGTIFYTSCWVLCLFILTWSLWDHSNFSFGGFWSPPSSKLLEKTSFPLVMLTENFDWVDQFLVKH